jgi:NAD(P)-dependent dehydrogenase (short-subunit alcohol dehydrogenase family)
MFNLENKVIVVTGGNGLLGKAIIRYLQSCQATTISLDITQEQESKFARICDITDEEIVSNSIQSIISDFSRIDGWVNNAYPRTEDWGNKFEYISAASWKRNVDMQMNSCFVCCQLVLEHMKQQQKGVVINMASIYGVVGPDFSIYEGTQMTMPAAYSAIKGGIVNFTKYLASYYGSFNLNVNCISPGGIFNHQNPSFVENYNRKVPLKRLGTPDDIAPSVAFLLSDEASYITGHNLVIDGGWTAI